MAQEVQIWERKSGTFVAATFYEELTVDQMAEAEAQWKPVRNAAVKQLRSSGKAESDVRAIIQHGHWDWVKKAKNVIAMSLTFRCFGIKLKDKWQGLATVDLGTHRAEVEPDRGKPIVYVEFLESAPWNLETMVDDPQYGLIGKRLVEAAIHMSIAEEFRGRVGLLALPQAEGFYEKCGMIRVESARRHGMSWFEMTQEGANEFIEGG